jgi:hypothetical protein
MLLTLQSPTVQKYQLKVFIYHVDQQIQMRKYIVNVQQKLMVKLRHFLIAIQHRQHVGRQHLQIKIAMMVHLVNIRLNLMIILITDFAFENANKETENLLVQFLKWLRIERAFFSPWSLLKKST